MLHADDVILTPNARLARTLQLADTAHQMDQGAQTWARPTIQPLSVWYRQLQVDAFLAADQMPAPLAPEQARLIWQSIIESEIFAGQSGLAEMAQAAYLKIHEHGCPHPSTWSGAILNKDQQAFVRWTRAYDRHCQEHHWLDFGVFLSKIPMLIKQGRVALPASITLHGFDIEPAPAYLSALDAMAEAGVGITRSSSNKPSQEAGHTLHVLPTLDDELISAIDWARFTVEQHPEQHVAIVVPTLHQELDRVEKHAKAILDPPAMCLEGPSTQSWHISLGHPLNKTPLVAEALHILKLAHHKFHQPDAARLLRSPWLKGVNEEQAERHRLVLWLNDKEPYWLDASTVIRRAKSIQANAFSKQLNQWHRQRLSAPTRASSDQWAEQFQLELTALGFGFGRTLDRVEYQTLQHWHRVLEQFAGLQAAYPAQTSHMTRAQALEQLNALAHNMLFREQDLGAPIAILGIQEALGAQFDAVWLTGMDEDSWPQSPQRDPLIPGVFQTDIPTASAEGCLALAKQQVAGLMATAPLIHASHHLGDDALPKKPSRLLDSWAQWRVEVHAEPRQAMPIKKAALEQIEDDSCGPGVQEELTRGGVHLLNAQSTCPFKAFGLYRLKARDHRTPRPGISAKDRGTLIHDALEAIWRELEDSDGLASLNDAQLMQKTAEHVNAQLDAYMAKHPKALEEMARQLEADNLVTKIQRWLTLERERPTFRTEHLENSIELTIGPLTLEGKIDRIDQLEHGDHVVIDYKTGKTSRSDWNPTGRIKDAQLPAYALSLDPPPKAIAFAKLTKDGTGFEGFSDGVTGITGVEPIEKYKHAPFKMIEDWETLVTSWKRQLNQLATDYHRGYAAVDPAKSTSCKHCHLKPMCRIQERSAWIDTESDEAGDGALNMGDSRA